MFFSLTVTVLDSELLLALLEEAGLDVADALSRMHVVCAFSESQQAEAAGLVEGLMGRLEDVSLIAVQQTGEEFDLNPPAGYVLKDGDVIAVVGLERPDMTRI